MLMLRYISIAVLVLLFVIVLISFLKKKKHDSISGELLVIGNDSVTIDMPLKNADINLVEVYFKAQPDHCGGCSGGDEPDWLDWKLDKDDGDDFFLTVSWHVTSFRIVVWTIKT